MDIKQLEINFNNLKREFKDVLKLNIGTRDELKEYEEEIEELLNMIIDMRSKQSLVSKQT